MSTRTVVFVAALLAVLGAACSSSADDTDLAGEADPAAEAPVTAPAAFCEPANAFLTSTAARFITTPDAVVFQDLDGRLAEMAEQAPAAIVNDVDALRDGFAAIDEAYASTGYVPTASFELPTEVQQANLEASRNLEDYLIRGCELDRIRAEQIAQIAEAFGIEDATTAECLHAQMGDVANIDPSALTPELMTTPVCGTSILGLLSGESIDG